MRLAQERKVDELAAYLAGFLRQLAAGGCTLATIPAFSPQVCAKQLAEITPLPLIGLLETAVAEVKRRGFTRVGVFGARVTMETRLFGALSGQAEVIVPASADLDFVSATYSGIVEKESALPEELGEPTHPGPQTDRQGTSRRHPARRNRLVVRLQHPKRRLPPHRRRTHPYPGDHARARRTRTQELMAARKRAAV